MGRLRLVFLFVKTGLYLEPAGFNARSTITSPVQPACVSVLATTTTSWSFRMREKASTPGANVEMPKWMPSPEMGRKYCRP